MKIFKKNPSLGFPIFTFYGVLPSEPTALGVWVCFLLPLNLSMLYFVCLGTHTHGTSSQLVAIIATYGGIVPYILYLPSTCFTHRVTVHMFLYAGLGPEVLFTSTASQPHLESYCNVYACCGRFKKSFVPQNSKYTPQKPIILGKQWEQHYMLFYSGVPYKNTIQHKKPRKATEE